MTLALQEAVRNGATNPYRNAAVLLNRRDTPPPPKHPFWTGALVFYAARRRGAEVPGVPRPREMESRVEAVANLKTLYDLTQDRLSCVKFAWRSAARRGAQKRDTIAAEDLNAAAVSPPPETTRTYWIAADVANARAECSTNPEREERA